MTHYYEDELNRLFADRVDIKEDCTELMKLLYERNPSVLGGIDDINDVDYEKERIMNFEPKNDSEYYLYYGLIDYMASILHAPSHYCYEPLAELFIYYVQDTINNK